MPSGVYPQLNKKGQPHPAAGLNQQWFTAKGVVRTGFHLDEATGKYTSGRKTRAKDRTRFEGISTLDIGGEDVRVPKKTPLDFKVFQQDPKIGNYHAGDGPQFQLSKMNMIDDLAAEHGIFRTGILDAPLYKYGPQPPRADVGVMRNANLHIKGYGGASLFQTTEEYKAQQKASVVSSLRQPTLQGPQYQHLLDATKFKGKVTKGFTPMTPFSEQAFDDKLARIKKKRLKVKEGSMAAYQPKTFKPTFDSPPPTPILVHEKQGPRMNKVSHREKMIADRERSAREDARLQRERDAAEKAETKRIAAEKAAKPKKYKEKDDPHAPIPFSSDFANPYFQKTKTDIKLIKKYSTERYGRDALKEAHILQAEVDAKEKEESRLYYEKRDKEQKIKEEKEKKRLEEEAKKPNLHQKLMLDTNYKIAVKADHNPEGFGWITKWDVEDKKQYVAYIAQEHAKAGWELPTIPDYDKHMKKAKFSAKMQGDKWTRDYYKEGKDPLTAWRPHWWWGDGPTAKQLAATKKK